MKGIVSGDLLCCLAAPWLCTAALLAIAVEHNQQAVPRE